jgi:hypothetical protein
LVPLSFATSGGPQAWRDFARNTRANVRSTGSNTVGLMSILSYEHANRRAVLVDPELEDPDRIWLDAKRRVFARRRPVFWILLSGFVLLLARAVRREEDWSALVLGIGLIPIATFVACYYYSILLGYGLLWERRREAIGAVLCALSVATHLGLYFWPSALTMDQRFAWNSLTTVIAVGLVTLFPGRLTGGQASPSEAKERAA